MKKLPAGHALLLILAILLLAPAFAQAGSNTFGSYFNTSEPSPPRFSFQIPNDLSTSGTDELPDDPAAPGTQDQIVVVNDPGQAQSIFGNVRGILSDRFGMRVEEPVQFVLVPESDTTILHGVYMDFGDDWYPFDPSLSVQVGRITYGGSPASFHIYVLQGLEQSESTAWMAGLLGSAWFYEHSYHWKDVSRATTFAGWIQYKVSIGLSNYYQAKTSLDEDCWGNFGQTLLPIERQSGERGVFQWAVNP